MYNKKIILIVLAAAMLSVQGLALLSKPKIAVNKNGLFMEDADKGRAALKKEEAPVVLAQAAETIAAAPLNAELLGTAISNVKDPIAFIKDLNTQKQAIYRLGSKLQDGKVVKIVMGEVVVDIDGRKETLQLSKRARAWAGLDGNSPVVSAAGDRIVVSKRGLMGQKNKIVSSLKTVKIKPYLESKEVVGMKVEGVPEESLIAAAGIRNNDIVQSVNNQKIDSYQKALQVFSKVRNQSEIKVSLLRGGQVKNLTYQMGN